jgi:hypothetical protein
LRENVDKLRIRDNALFAADVSCNAQLGHSLASVPQVQSNEDSGVCDEAVSCSIFSNTVIVHDCPSVSGAMGTGSRSCKHLGAHNKNLCIECSAFPVTSSSTSSVSSEVKQIETESFIKLNIPRFKVKATNDSDKGNITDGYYVFFSQSRKLQNKVKTNDSPRDVASGEYNSLSLTEVPERQTSIVQEPKSSEESNQFSSLAQLANRHSKILKPKSSEESNQFSSLAQLANRHSKILKPNSSEESNQFSSLAQLANRHSKTMEPKSSEETNHFSSIGQLANKQSSEGQNSSSLAQLANIYDKMTKPHASDEDNNFCSLVKLANMHSGSEVQANGQLSTQAELTSQHQQVQREDAISLLTSLLSLHLKVDENETSSNRGHIVETERAQKVEPISCSRNAYVDLKTCFVFSPENETMASTEQEAISPVVQRSDNLATCSQASDIGSNSKRIKLCPVSEKTDELVRDCGTSSDSSSTIRAEPGPVVRTVSEEENEFDWEIDLTNALISPGSKTSQISPNSKPKVTGWKLQDLEGEVPSDTAMDETSEIMLDFDLSLTILNQKLPIHKRKSPFGRTLCRKWKRLPTPYVPPQKQSLGKLVRFAFNTVSPDDKILRHLKMK